MVLIISLHRLRSMQNFRKNHEFAAILMHDRQFHHFIIITNIVPVEHDAIIRREHALGDPLA